MNLIDTCGWIEWLTNGKLCTQYEPYFTQTNKILVPTSVQFELYKWIIKKKNIQHALEAIALTEQGNVAPLSTSIALLAADFSAEYKLSFADAIIYASAKSHDASLITSDHHFSNLPGVIYFKK